LALGVIINVQPISNQKDAKKTNHKVYQIAGISAHYAREITWKSGKLGFESKKVKRVF
jgi:hypothetical protein